jgi:single-strand selective monofunctional uracil DNA glycosylase
VDLFKTTDRLVARLSELKFSDPVTHVYNPLVYARASWNTYLKNFGPKTGESREILLLGMNPGPFGMAQTGIPFGEVAHVRDWMGIKEKVGKPPKEHPKRPVEGFDCPRSEVSGARLWGWAKRDFGTADKFFARFFVANYCPLVFMGETGKNITPDQLPAKEAEPVNAACDEALREIVLALKPKYCVGVGGFAEECLERALTGVTGFEYKIGKILHPSPASPLANKDWAGAALKNFKSMGISIP